MKEIEQQRKAFWKKYLKREKVESGYISDSLGRQEGMNSPLLLTTKKHKKNQEHQSLQ